MELKLYLISLIFSSKPQKLGKTLSQLGQILSIEVREHLRKSNVYLLSIFRDLKFRKMIQ
jgi:hypothetical protein